MITARMGVQAQPKDDLPKDAAGKDLPGAASTAVNSKSLRDYMLIATPPAPNWRRAKKR